MNDGLSLADYVVLVLILLCVFSTASTVLDIHDLLVDNHEAREVRLAKQNINTKPTLPDICRPLYGNGTEDWITCIPVIPEINTPSNPRIITIIMRFNFQGTDMLVRKFAGRFILV